MSYMESLDTDVGSQVEAQAEPIEQKSTNRNEEGSIEPPQKKNC